MLLMLMESVRSELQFAAHSTGQTEFKKAIDALNIAISLTESNQPEQASEKIAIAISASTTPAQEAWQVLKNMESSDFLDFLTSRSWVRLYKGTL